ncbi:MAG TPA: hypothetical protein VNW04_13150 [Puia sp.]|jgi:hypothetical protein|nr:hypothetical protein [Puia sp.]
MAKSKGRPPKARKQEKNIGFFVTRLQYFVIQQKAAKAGVNISDYMRQVAVNGQVKARWTKEEWEMVKGLIGISADIHSLVEIAGKQGATQAVLFFARYRDVMDFIINTLCHDR